jgi:hypothetical protein
MRDLITWMSFEANREYIAEVLCINNEKPITVCGGSCYLQIQLEENHSEESDPKAVKIISETVTFLLQSTVTLDPDQYVWILLAKWSSYGQDYLPSGYAFSVFRPPIG